VIATAHRVVGGGLRLAKGGAVILATWTMPSGRRRGILIGEQTGLELQLRKGGAPGQPLAIGATLDGPLLP
jgi:hypothetical protein